MSINDIFPLTSTRPTVGNKQIVYYPVIKTNALIKAENQNKHLVKLLNSKMFTGYRKIKNKQKFIQKYKDKQKFYREEMIVYPFQEEYDIIYKHKYLVPSNTQLNWKNSFDIKKLKFNQVY